METHLSDLTAINHEKFLDRDTLGLIVFWSNYILNLSCIQRSRKFEGMFYSNLKSTSTFVFIVVHNRDENTLIDGSQFNRRPRMSFNISLIIITSNLIDVFC